MAVRLLDIARRAKVSPGAVSAVVNRSRSNTVVSPETKRRILAIAKKLGYVPNAAARAVRHRQFMRIAAAIVQYGPPGTSYTPHNGYLDAAVNELAERGYSLVLEPLHLDYQGDRFFEPPRLFSELAVDGVLGAGVGRGSGGRR
jgi:LacI family transcriptional regulator